MGKFTLKRRERRIPAPELVGVDDIQPQLRPRISAVQITVVTLVTKLWCNLIAAEQFPIPDWELMVYFIGSVGLLVFNDALDSPAMTTMSECFSCFLGDHPA